MVKGRDVLFQNTVHYYIAIVKWQSPLRYRQGNRKIPYYYQLLYYLLQYFSSFLLLKRNLPQIFALLMKSIRNDPSVYPTFYNGMGLWLQILPQTMSVLAEPLAATRGTLRFDKTPIETHWSNGSCAFKSRMLACMPNCNTNLLYWKFQKVLQHTWGSLVAY